MKIWFVLERPRYSLASKIWSAIYFLFVFLAIISFILETLRNLRKARETFRTEYLQVFNYTLVQACSMMSPVHFMAVTVPLDWLHYLRYLTFTFFLLDFLLRLATCPLRTEFFKQPRNWLEIAVTIKTAAHFVMEIYVFDKETSNITEFQKNLSLIMFALTGVRALRILYLANVFQVLKVLILCFKSSLADLLMLIICVLCFVLLFGTSAYLAEVISGLWTFPSMSEAMWWAIITMTTVGYGDVYPESVAGKLVGSLCALSGVVVLALPIAVIASNFTAYHANLSPYRQRATRKAFLKENPHFDLNHNPDHQGHDQNCGELALDQKTSEAAEKYVLSGQNQTLELPSDKLAREHKLDDLVHCRSSDHTQKSKCSNKANNQKSSHYASEPKSGDFAHNSKHSQSHERGERQSAGSELSSSDGRKEGRTVKQNQVESV